MRPKDLFLMIEAYNEVHSEKAEMQIVNTREVIAAIMNNGFVDRKTAVRGIDVWPLPNDPEPEKIVEYTQEELQNIEDRLNRSIEFHYGN
jgi:hypothetical protein